MSEINDILKSLIKLLEIIKDNPAVAVAASLVLAVVVYIFISYGTKNPIPNGKKNDYETTTIYLDKTQIKGIEVEIDRAKKTFNEELKIDIEEIVSDRKMNVIEKQKEISQLQHDAKRDKSRAIRNAYLSVLCPLVSNAEDTRIKYPYSYENKVKKGIEVDCENKKEVYRWVIGNEKRLDLDMKDSLDSVTWALAYAHMTKKNPVVAIYNPDGDELDEYGYMIKAAAEAAGVGFSVLRLRK